MARIRTIKPEFWDDEKLSKVSRDGRLTFIGMWTHSDDFGVVKGHVSWLKNNIFPYDDLPSDTFKAWLDELVSIGFIIPFDANGETFYLIKNFNKHQVIDRPSKSRNPPPPPSYSSNPRRQLDDNSTSTRRVLDETSLMEGKGKGKGKGTSKRELSLSLVPADAGVDPSAQVADKVGTSSHDVADVQEDDGNVTGDVQGQGQPELSPRKPSRHPPCPHLDIIAAYHESMPANPRIRHLDETSQRNLRARWREDPERQTVDWWREFFAWCAQSRFLTGQKSDFIADLMWIVRPQNFAKVLAGRYHHENPNGNLPLRTRQNMAAADAVKRLIREGKL